MSAANGIRAVLWDFGGVILSSPFDAFAAYEAANGLPKDFIRALNATNPDANAWARMERSEVDTGEFCRLFEAEARAAGHALDAAAILALLSGEIRPAMVNALRIVDAHYKTACLTNNVKAGAGPGMARGPDKAAAIDEIMGIFDVIVESSKVGIRKPEPAFYAMACEMLAIEPAEAVYLDDLGINLKPARAMGMHTIKVGDPDRAIADLEAVLGLSLRAPG